MATGGRKRDDAGGWSAEERAAMRDRARETRPQSRKRLDPAAAEAEVLAKLAGMAPADRALGERLHRIVLAAAPELVPRLWYGMPAYSRDGKTICFFQDAGRFKTRYATFGFQHDAALDAGRMWPVAFAIVELTPDVEAQITELVRRAAA